MEAVGLVLNILPLIVSVTENYKELVLTPFCRYQSFRNEAGRYVVRLKNQHAIFEAQCIHLLGLVTDERLASAIINAPDKCAPEELRQVGERLEMVESNSRNALIRTMESISSLLTEIIRDGDRLSSAVKVEDEAERQSGKLKLLSKEWKNHIRQKLKFSFSKSRLSLELDTMTQLNRDFSAISDLVILKPPSLTVETLSEKQTKTRVAREHQAMGKAAQAISASLNELSCNSEEIHLADLCVVNERVVQSEQYAPKIEFEAAFHCPTSYCTFLHLSVSGLLVDKFFRDSVVGRDKLESGLTSILSLDKDCLKAPRQTSEPRAAFELGCSNSCKNTASEQGSSRPCNLVPDGDVCGFLRQSIRGFNDGDLFIKASLANDRERKVGVPMNRTSECPMDSEAICLSDFLDLPPDAKLRMPIYKRIWLAKTLVIAFFRYHHTGWAGGGWESRGVCFHVSNSVESRQSSALNQPWLRCHVHSPKLSSIYGIGWYSGLRRNEINLFALGAMLIEIGYSMNWESLCDTPQAVEDDTLNSFFQARRLLGQGLLDMGSTYRNIVEKLIESIFPNGYDLDNWKSRELFIEEIIRPLEEEERKLRDVLYGNSPTGVHESQTGT